MKYKAIMVRTPIDIYNKIVDESLINKVSLNELCVQKLTCDCDIKPLKTMPRGPRAKKVELNDAR